MKAVTSRWLKIVAYRLNRRSKKMQRKEGAWHMLQNLSWEKFCVDRPELKPLPTSNIENYTFPSRLVHRYASFAMPMIQ